MDVSVTLRSDGAALERGLDMRAGVDGDERAYVPVSETPATWRVLVKPALPRAARGDYVISLELAPADDKARAVAAAYATYQQASDDGVGRGRAVVRARQDGICGCRERRPRRRRDRARRGGDVSACARPRRARRSARRDFLAAARARAVPDGRLPRPRSARLESPRRSVAQGRRGHRRRALLHRGAAARARGVRSDDGRRHPQQLRPAHGRARPHRRGHRAAAGRHPARQRGQLGQRRRRALAQHRRRLFPPRRLRQSDRGLRARRSRWWGA